jgi:PII-like signaling protein
MLHHSTTPGLVGEGAMKITGPAKCVRIYVGESDQWHGRPLYTAIVERLRREDVAGATVFHGIEGYGANSRIHTARILRLSEDLPVVIEVVDIAERIERILPLLDEMVTEGLVTIQDVEVIKYVHSQQQQ